MISVSLTQDGDGRLVPAYASRRPDETLYDYLLRSRHEMGVHIRMLEATSDAQTELFRSERARWRRVMILLMVGGAGSAAAAYLLLDLEGLAGDGSAPLLAAIIASCALAGSAASVGITSMLGRAASWRLAADNVVQRLLRRPRQVVEPSATVLPLIRASDDVPEAAAMKPALKSEGLARGVDPDPQIEAVIEDCAISRLDMRTTFWGIGLLVFQAAIVTIGLSAARIAFGVPLDMVMNDAPLVLVVCVVGGLFLLTFAEIASSGLARLGRWWRRR